MISKFTKVNMVLLLKFATVTLVFAACPSPEVPEDVYALTPASNRFDTGTVFNVVCVPGNRPENTAQLRCDPQGNWVGNWPDCSIRQSKARWWMLLLGLVSIIILIPCILPRLYFHYIDTSEPREFLLSRSRQKALEKSLYGTKGIEMQEIPPGRKERISVGTEVHDRGPELYPKPLPPIRHREYTPDSHKKNVA